MSFTHAHRRTENTSFNTLAAQQNKHIPSIFFSDKVEKLEVILGRTFRKQNSSGEQIFKVEKYWIHEKFDNETFDNDIGE